MNNIEVIKTYHAVLELYEVAEELDLCILVGVQEPEAALVRRVLAREPRGLQATYISTIICWRVKLEATLVRRVLAREPRGLQAT